MLAPNQVIHRSYLRASDFSSGDVQFAQMLWEDSKMYPIFLSFIWAYFYLF